MQGADGDSRAVVGPTLRAVVGTRRRRRWLRRVLGGPAMVLRWLATRGDATVEAVHRDRPSRTAPTLATLPDGQPPSAGVGPGVHRTYRVVVPGVADEAAAAIDRLVESPNLHCTIELGSFEADDGDDEVRLEEGRVLRVELAGPFVGPVRVVERDERRVRLQTRTGHPEAGQILFETIAADGDLVFTIASWTRSRDRLVDVLYRGGPARWLQQHMWISVCRQVALGAGGDDPVVTVLTEWLPPDVELLGERSSG